MATDFLSTVWPEWKIEGKPLGRGSYGTVYKAVRRDHNVESYAAIKVISIPADQSEVETFRSEGLDINATRTYFQGVVNDFVSEIQLMESFKGVQNIVSVEDYKVVEKQDEIGWDIYIRMELLTPLNSYICDNPLSEAEVIKLGVDICSALELCAKRNVIHRDIKPENIFINQFGDFKLGDFGIARKLENVTGGLSQKGTFNYMAPEVEKGMQYDASVDLYSLGLVLYRFTNKNRLPFLDTESQLLNPNERMAAIRRRMSGEPLPPPCEASPALAQAILFACAYDPNCRFASAFAMKNALLHAANEANMGNNSFNETMPVRPVQQSQDLNRTASVWTAPQAQETIQQLTVDTLGEKKKSKIPVVISSILIVAFLIGAGIFALPKLFSKDNSYSNSTSENSDRLDTDASLDTTNGVDSDYDEKQISAALQEAEALAANSDYEGALERIKTALATYPKSDSLQAKETEYTEALAVQTKTKTLEEAAKLANSGDYLGAMTLIESARADVEEDAEYKTAYDNYKQAYYSQVKTTAVTEADSLAQQGEYLDAIARIDQAISIIGDDSELKEKKMTYEDNYVTHISEQVDSYLAENNVTAAKELIDAALEKLPNNESLKTRKAELEQYKTVSLSSLSPINGGFPWNEDTPGDSFGNSYSDVQNYTVLHAVRGLGSSIDSWAEDYSAEYKLDKMYSTLSFYISPYSDFGETGESYIQVYVNDVLRYTSPLIKQKTEPFRTPDIDISDADYLKINVHVGGCGCLMMSDVFVQSSPLFVSSLDKNSTSLSALKPLNGSLPWESEYPSDINNNDYASAQNYAFLRATTGLGSSIHGWSKTYSAEYYIGKNYDSISLDIVPAICYGQSASTTIKIYADDKLVYTSNAITQKTTLFNTGEIKIAGADYVKIVVDVDSEGCIIISNVLLKNAA